jgi:D-glycero-D-manno-heptose 1,7-bisphosphate phosphatase
LRRAVFLDRDGVINKAIIRAGKPFPPADINELIILPGVEEALDKLRTEKFHIIVVTNQPDVARGLNTRKNVEGINQYLSSRLPINEFFVCYHDEIDCCDCRKPQPGALLRAANKYDINLHQSYMIGDRWRDIQAGKSAGCKTFFIDYSYAEQRPNSPDYIVSSLLQAQKIILEELK